MADLPNGGLTLRRQGRHAQRRPAPEIRTAHRRAVKRLYPRDHRHPAGHPNVGPHAGQLVDVTVTAGKQVFLKHRSAPASQQGRHQNGLGVGGEAGIGSRPHRAHRRQTVPADTGHAPLLGADGTARFPQHRGNGGQMRLPRSLEEDLASGGSRRAKVSRRHNPVGHDGISTAVERLSTLHGHRGGSRPGNLGSAGGEKLLEIHDLRLPGGVGNGGDAVRAAGRQHQVFRRPHGGQAQHNLPPLKAGRFTVENASGVVDLRPQVPKAREMEVNWPGSQLTAAGVAQLRLAAPGQDRSQEDGGGPHLPHQPLRHGAAVQVPGVYQEDIFPLPAGRTAQVPQNMDRGVHVPKAGTSPQLHLARCQQCRRQNGQNAVFRPLDLRLTAQTTAASYR